MGTEAVAGPTSPPGLQPRLVQHSGAGPNPASGGTPCVSVLLISVVVLVIGCVYPAPCLSLLLVSVVVLVIGYVYPVPCLSC